MDDLLSANEALNASADLWRHVASGKAKRVGSTFVFADPLCNMYRSTEVTIPPTQFKSNGVVKVTGGLGQHCSPNCPVKQATGKDRCEDLPLQDVTMMDNYPGNPYHARAMFVFLHSLIR